MARTFAQSLRNVFNAWLTIESAVREEFPEADEEEIYQLTKLAMYQAMGVKPPIEPPKSTHSSAL